jgi:hypothetical protein
MIEQHNVIKRNTISIKGIITINTSATKKGDMIHATKTDYGWRMLNMETGKHYQCCSDMLRRFVNITEQI